VIIHPILAVTVGTNGHHGKIKRGERFTYFFKQRCGIGRATQKKVLPDWCRNRPGTPEARSEIFNYIEFFHNPNRRHGNNDGVSPAEFEKQYFEKLSSV